jgi:hypothetical protein
MKNSHTRKGNPAIKVYCTPDDRAQLQANAAAARKSVSSYMLHIGLGYGVRGLEDHRTVEDLLLVNGDLGRLGGLLKLLLSNEERTAMLGESRVRALLGKVETTQDEIRAVIRAVVMPGPGPRAF